MRPQPSSTPGYLAHPFSSLTSLIQTPPYYKTLPEIATEQPYCKCRTCKRTSRTDPNKCDKNAICNPLSVTHSLQAKMFVKNQTIFPASFVKLRPEKSYPPPCSFCRAGVPILDLEGDRDLGRPMSALDSFREKLLLLGVRDGSGVWSPASKSSKLAPSLVLELGVWRGNPADVRGTSMESPGTLTILTVEGDLRWTSLRRARSTGMDAAMMVTALSATPRMMSGTVLTG